MKVSRAGIDLIKRFEGCRLKSYQDSVGVWTIGYGHTSAAGVPQVVKGMSITQQEADDILVRDLVKYEAGVQRALTRSPTQNQFDAMVSLCFNIGEGAFAGSTLVRRFNAGDIAGASDAFLMWNKAGGKVLPGLESRRKDERALFLKQPAVVAPVSPPAAPIPAAVPDAPPAATPSPPGASLAGWIMGAAAALVAVLAAWLVKG